MYEEFPEIDEEYFHLGFDAKDLYQKIHACRTLKIPRCFNIGTHVKMIEAPKYDAIYIGKSYNFEFYVPRGLSIAQ